MCCLTKNLCFWLWVGEDDVWEVFGSCVAVRADVEEAVRSPGSVTKDTSSYHNMVSVISVASPIQYIYAVLTSDEDLSCGVGVWLISEI